MSEVKYGHRERSRSVPGEVSVARSFGGDEGHGPATPLDALSGVCDNGWQRQSPDSERVQHG